MRRVALALILSSCLTGAAAAQLVPALNSKPEAYPKPVRVPEARDIPFPGTLQLTVDASDVTRGIFLARLLRALDIAVAHPIESLREVIDRALAARLRADDPVDVDTATSLIQAGSSSAPTARSRACCGTARPSTRG